jgi:hypothetical protein
MWATVLE